MVYAIIRSGGKQHRVEPEQVVDVERLPASVGSTIELNDVLLVASTQDTKVGQPLVEHARVVAEVMEQNRGAKEIIFKYKSKTRYRRKIGHRQSYTRLAIRRILIGDELIGEAKTGVKSTVKAQKKTAKSSAKQAVKGSGKIKSEATAIEKVPETKVAAKGTSKPKSRKTVRATKVEGKNKTKPTAKKKTEKQEG